MRKNMRMISVRSEIMDTERDIFRSNKPLQYDSKLSAIVDDRLYNVVTGIIWPMADIIQEELTAERYG